MAYNTYMSIEIITDSVGYGAYAVALCSACTNIGYAFGCFTGGCSAFVVLDVVPPHAEDVLGSLSETPPRDGRGRLYALWVNPNRRGEDLGTQLLHQLASTIKEKQGVCEVVFHITSTPTSRGFYEKNGAQVIEGTGSKQSGVQLQLRM